MTRRPRVLYLAFYFPPSRASGVFRARATANHLAQSGWDVTVHTAPREFFEDYLHAVDDSLEATLDPRLRVVRPRMGYAHWETDIRRFGRFRATFPSLDATLRRKRSDLSFPEPYATWIPSVLAHAAAEHARRPYDVVVATGNPFASFAAAWMLHRTLRVPYVLDYRDAWTFNQFTEEVRYPPGHRAWRWEERVLAEAAEVVFVNDGMRGWYADRYPQAAGRMTVVPNGWEPEILGDPGADAPDTSAASGSRPLRFGYVGTITESMPTEPLLEGWRLAREQPELAGATLDLHGHLGFFPRQREALRAQIPTGDGTGVAYHGPAPKASIAQVYAGLDVLLLWLPGARYVTSGKVFEYMATAKPVVSVHRPDLAAVEVLRDYPLWAPNASLEPKDVADALVAGARAARGRTPEQAGEALAHARRYTRAAVLEPFEQRLRGLARA
jgi:glycosyltransferase involved in cell wall biosynthesis